MNASHYYLAVFTPSSPLNIDERNRFRCASHAVKKSTQQKIPVTAYYQGIIKDSGSFILVVGAEHPLERCELRLNNTATAPFSFIASSEMRPQLSPLLARYALEKRAHLLPSTRQMLLAQLAIQHPDACELLVELAQTIEQEKRAYLMVDNAYDLSEANEINANTLEQISAELSPEEELSLRVSVALLSDIDELTSHGFSSEPNAL
jgi:hypothetical protein